MPNLSPVEILVVGMLALVVFGPDKLPGIARNIGRTLSDLRRMASEARTEFRMGLDDTETPVADEQPVKEANADADAPAAEQPRQ